MLTTETAEVSALPTIKAPPLALFSLLEAPYGMQSAVVTLVPMYLMRSAGLGIEQAGAIAAFCLLPSTFYFAYSPLVDFFVRRRTWLLMAVFTTALLAATVIGLSGSTGRVQLITGMLFTSTVASMLISAATGGLMSALLDARGKARVGAWVQVGNLGANSLFFGLLLFVYPHCSRPVLGLLAGLAILVPGLAGFAVREPRRVPAAETYVATLRGIAREFKATFLSLRSLPGILLLLSPMGSGAITGVMSGLTKEYGASADQLGFANGWGGGLLTAAGALGVLLMPARWNRMLPYALAGAIYGGVSLLIATGPLQPMTLIVGLLASNFVQGIAYAAYTGLLLQTMGIGGRCHSGRYTILNSIGNVPVVYMTALLSQVAGRFGTRSVGVFDGALNLLTVAIFLAWWTWVRRARPSFVTLTEAAVVEA
jgi:PAT family beta-lactamase induction signal transducer AmpG